MVNTEIIRRILTGLTVSAICLFSGCEKPGAVGNAPAPAEQSEAVRDISSNSLVGLPGEVYTSQAASPIHWRPWTEETKIEARDSRRLILAMVVLPQQPSYATILRELYADEALVRQINDKYVPVLIDGDAIRELGILTADLCAEIGSGLQLPLLVWMTDEANPVAWIPLTSGQSGSIAELFMQSHLMVGRMWTEDPSYVSMNSRLDQKNRRQRLEERRTARQTSDEPATDSVRALRQLISLYDPVSRTFDEAGGLFPCAALDLLSMGARTEGLPEDIREKSATVLRYLLDDLLPSPMFDPLDGGVYSSRRGLTWALPGYYRDCATQARVVVSLMDSYEVTGDARALERALGVLGFIEMNCKTSGGLYALGVRSAGDAEQWLWTIEDVKSLLDREETAALIAATGMKEMGNLPSEVDPRREFFRMNSLRFAKSPEEIAMETGADPAATRELIDGARRKLLKARDERLRDSTGAMHANAAATFRVISAFASAYRITGEGKYLDMAVETLGKAKDRFSDGPRLRLYEGDAPASLTAGRAFLYGLALNAILDTAAVSLDDSLLIWADDLATTVSELFAGDGYIRECPPDGRLMDLTITDLAMLFDESTAGLIGMAEARMKILGRPVLDSFGSGATGLPMDAMESPILHTDIIQATLVRKFGQLLVYGPDVPEDFLAAIAGSPLKGIQRRADNGFLPAGITLPPSGVLRFGPGKEIRPVQNVGELRVPSLHYP